MTNEETANRFAELAEAINRFADLAEKLSKMAKWAETCPFESDALYDLMVSEEDTVKGLLQEQAELIGDEALTESMAGAFEGEYGELGEVEFWLALAKQAEEIA